MTSSSIRRVLSIATFDSVEERLKNGAVLTKQSDADNPPACCHWLHCIACKGNLGVAKSSSRPHPNLLVGRSRFTSPLVRCDQS